MQRPTFFARRSLFILVVVFFFVPFALRGARMAMQGMKNDVKDWLPKDLQETQDLDEFRRYFLSEQFVLVSWDGCYGDENDERFQLFIAKLTPETPPSVLKAQAEAAAKAAGRSAGDRSLAEPQDARSPKPKPSRSTARRATSTTTTTSSATSWACTIAGDWHENWGEQRREVAQGPAARAAKAATRNAGTTSRPTATCFAGTASMRRMAVAGSR